MKKTSFIIYYPYQWFIYKNIYQKLDAAKREVIVDLGFQPLLQDEEVKQSIKKILDENNVTYRILHSYDFYRTSYLEDFFKDVEVMVSCWESSCIALDETAHIKKVCVTYGIAKELTMIRPSRSVYDVILAYGERDAALFSLMTKSVAIGNPRVDDYYQNKPHTTRTAKTILAFKKPNKKTILFVPTHGDLGSLAMMKEVIATLSSTYTFIVKPHYYTLREERELVAAYQQIADVLVIDDSYDTIEAMVLSDVVLSDNSSAVFDAMQVKKPIVVCDFVSHKYIDENHKNLRFSKRGVVGATTYSKSLEQEIKEKNMVIKLTSPNNLHDTLLRVDELQTSHVEEQKALVSEHFAYSDGRSAERAVKIIEEMYTQERTHVPGILHHAYLSFNNRIIRTMLTQKVEAAKMDLIEKKVHVWILCDAETRQDQLSASVYSALENTCVTSVYITNLPSRELAAAFEGLPRAVITSSEEVLSKMYHSFGEEDDVLITKSNTILKKIGVAATLKNVNDKEVVFFAENILYRNSDSVSNLFGLLKKEILNKDSDWRDLMLDVTFNQIKSIEKSAILVSVKKVREHDPYSFPVVSFEQLTAFMIELYLFRAMPFFILPNFFTGLIYAGPEKVMSQMVKRAVYLEIDNFPVKQWADYKPFWYMWNIVRGRVEYVALLRLLITKIVTYQKIRLQRSKR